MNPKNIRILLAIFMGVTAISTGAAVIKTMQVSAVMNTPGGQPALAPDLSGNITIAPDASSSDVAAPQISLPSQSASIPVLKTVALPRVTSSAASSAFAHTARRERDDDDGSSEIGD